MFKLLIKLALAALLANATYRVGSEYLTYVRFRDAVQNAATVRATSDADLRQRIMELSVDYDIPLAQDAVHIRREERRLLVEGKHTKRIDLAPAVRYDWPFTWSIDAVAPAAVPPEK
jgi:hypothetical protein